MVMRVLIFGLVDLSFHEPSVGIMNSLCWFLCLGPLDSYKKASSFMNEIIKKKLLNYIAFSSPLFNSQKQNPLYLQSRLRHEPLQVPGQ